MSDKQDQKLSVNAVLTLIEYMSYDDKQLLTKKLNNRLSIYLIGSFDEADCYAETDEIKACRSFAIDKGITPGHIHSTLICKNDDIIVSCNPYHGKFCCNRCKQSICFICKQEVLLETHISIHTINEVSDELISKFIKTHYRLEEKRLK